MVMSSVVSDVISFFVTKNVKQFRICQLQNLSTTKIVNIEEENLCILWTTWGISMNFSGKMWLPFLWKARF